MIPKQIYIAGIAAILILSVFTLQHIKIQDLKTDIANLNTAIAYYEVELEKLRSSNDGYKRSINVQNEAINTLAINKTELDKKLEEWQNKPAEIRYKKIYKMREVKSNECKDIKDTIDSIRNLDFNSL